MCVSPNMLYPFRDDSKPEGFTYRMRAPALGDDTLFNLETGEVLKPFQVPCGKCLECIQAHKNEWTHRLLDEWSLYDKSMFLTLTYDPWHLPDEGVSKREYQLFIKRLRKFISPQKLRYFVCGEYGSKGHRPHYHLIIFGYAFPDLVFFRKDKKGFSMYRSKILEGDFQKEGDSLHYLDNGLWGKGECSVISTADKVLEYATKDMQKLLPLNDHRNPPFTQMSLKPGIGLAGARPDWLSGKIYHYGKYKSIPRYYLNKMEEDHPQEVFNVRKKRIQVALDHVVQDPYLKNVSRLTKNKQKLDQFMEIR